MTAIVKPRSAQRPRALIFVPGRGGFSGAVDVYRAPDGVGVVVRGEGAAVYQTPHGPIAVTGKVQMEFKNDAAFDWAKRKAFAKNPEKYAKLVGILGIDDDARNAPQLPSLAFENEGALPALPPPRQTDGDPEVLVRVAGFEPALDDDDAPRRPHASAALADLLETGTE